jgi:hypothetical protein
MRPMNRRWLASFLLFVPLGCAAGGDGDLPDATPFDGTLLDQSEPFESEPPQDTRPNDAGRDSTFDVVAPFDVIPPTDTFVPPTDAAKDAGTDGGLDCLAAGQLCNYDLDNCPAFFECQLAIVDGGGSPDGGLDAAPSDGGGMVEGGLGGSNNGICLYVFDIPTPCNDGVDHCSAGEKCLNASQICLTPDETICVCDNPKTAAACGPP